MPRRQGMKPVEECAGSFMSGSKKSENSRSVRLPDWLGTPGGRIPVFRLPSKPEDCCDLCEQLERLVVRIIGPDLRRGSIQALFFPCRRHLFVKLRLPEEGLKSSRFFDDRCFYIYSHPDVLCPWYLFHPYPFQKLEWALDKLQKCETAHDCYEKALHPLPTRVIKVGRRPGDIRLQNGGFCAPYICLSHCWGSKQPLTTTKQNVDDHFACIVWEDLPLLYQDTIRLAWRLGIEYIWIDSLCIIQNRPDDWIREAGRMQYVYGNSWLTVAATSNPNCCSGILDHPYDGKVRPDFASFKNCIDWSGVTRRDECFSWLAVPADINTCENDKHDKGACRWPLLTRGWVLQEQLLSPRVLYFTASNLLWSCKEVRETEDTVVGHYPQPTHLGKTTMESTGVVKNVPRTEVGSYPWLIDSFWRDIIKDYSNLKLTHQDDRLPALSGLAQKASQRMPCGSRYLAGLWSSSLCQELSWYNAQGSHDSRHNAPVGISAECSKRRSQGIPSWSWAAINTPVNFPPVFDASERSTFRTEIVEAGCTPLSYHDPAGRVSNGRIHMRGPISPVVERDLIAARRHVDHKIYFDCPLHMSPKYLIDNNIKCLILYSTDDCHRKQFSAGLLLKPLGGKNFEYRRVGLMYTKHRSGPPWFRRLSCVEDVVII